MVAKQEADKRAEEQLLGVKEAPLKDDNAVSRVNSSSPRALLCYIYLTNADSRGNGMPSWYAPEEATRACH